MIRTTLFIAILLSSIFVKAQTRDTLIINIDDYAQINISSMDIFRVHKRTSSIDVLFKSFYYDYLRSKTKIKSDRNVDVFHKMEDGIAKITMRERSDIADEVYIQDEKVQNIKSYPIKIHFLNHYPPYEKITLYVKNEKHFSQIAKLSLDSLRQSTQRELKKGIKNKTFKDKYSYKFIFNNSGNKINKEKRIVKRKSNKNYIDVRPMLGVFVAWSELESIGPNFGLDLGMTINKKQFQRYRMGLIANFSVIQNSIDTVPMKWQVINQLSLYFSINNSRSITNEMKFGISLLNDDFRQHFGPFAQYNIKKIGLRVDMPFTKYEIKEIFRNNTNVYVPKSEMSKYQISFSIFYNF